MTLYSAYVFDLAKPVPKKGKGKEAVAETAKEPEIQVEKEKQKKAPTEKQLAALAKAQESRKRKREEADAITSAAQKQEQERIAKETETKQKKEQKKQEQKEKRLLKKTEKAPATPPPTEASSSNGEELSLEEAIDHEVKKMKSSSNPSEPPVWFKQYVAGVKKEEAKISREKKPHKQIQKEAREVAQTSWDDGFTRDRLRNEVDGHMSRMYQMMFGGRRMK